MARKSNLRHQIFANEYVIDLNGTRAAIAAGYAPNSADVTASQLLDNPKVIRRINANLSRRASNGRGSQVYNSP